jgi:thioredoxin 1
VKILKVNIDEQPKLTSDFWVTSVPTVFFMKNGELQEGLAGASPKQVYQEKIDEYLA